MSKKLWHVEFTSAGLVKDPVGTIVANVADGGRRYIGTLYASDPDDALFKISEAYRGAVVRKCYRADQ